MTINFLKDEKSKNKQISKNKIKCCMMHTLHSTWDLMRLLLPLFHKRQNEYILY